jgi:hypothetical protein
VVEGGQQFPTDVVYQQTTKKAYSQYLQSQNAPESDPEPDASGATKEPQKQPESVKEIDEDDCRTALRAFRTAKANKTGDEVEANKALFELLKQFAPSGKLPDINPVEYPALHQAAVEGLESLTQ